DFGLSNQTNSDPSRLTRKKPVSISGATINCHSNFQTLETADTLSPAPRPWDFLVLFTDSYLAMADVEGDVAAPGVPKKRTFKKFSFRGVDLDALLDMSTDELVKLFPARARRRFQRGLKRKPMALIKNCARLSGKHHPERSWSLLGHISAT
ncbi:hypothetical protein E1A91_D11G143100v1, partial [Gossypium mustelinum]